MLYVRHNVSRPPYQDYNAMPLSTLEDIATFAIDPHIQSFDKEDLPGELVQMLKKGHPTRCSVSLRTRETHDLARSVLELPAATPIIDERLKEIWFKPSGFVNEGEAPLDAIRQRLYDCLIEGSPSTEPLEELLARVDGLLDDPKLKEAICFSHGFLMRFIKAYVDVDRNLERLPAALKSTPPIKYLGILEITNQD